MEQLEHELLLSKWVNALLGGPIGSLMARIGFSLDPTHPVLPDHLIMAFLLALVLIGGALWLRPRIRLENPGGTQLVLEALVEALLGMLHEIVGPKGRRFVGLVGTLGLFILCANLLGLVPGFKSPTANLNVTLGCAVVAFLYYNYQGVREQGLLGYLKHFAGPMPLLAPLYFPIEILSHLSRILSLSIRLFGNIFGEDLVILILASMIPLLVPLPMMFMAIFTSLLQAFVFVMLTMIYLGSAVAAEEQEH